MAIYKNGWIISKNDTPDYKYIANGLILMNQYGILLTLENGHYYLNYETDLELSPTSESKWLLERMSDIGITINIKQYGYIEDVIERFYKILEFLEW